MKNYKWLVSFLSIVLTLIFFTYSINAQTKTRSQGAKYCSEKKSKSRMFEKNLSSLNTPAHSFDVLNYTMNLDLFGCYAMPYPNYFSASVKIQFLAVDTINSISLNASNYSLQIDSIGLNGYSFTHLNDTLKIILSQTFLPGQVPQVMIFYHHLNVTDYAFYAYNGFVFTDCEPEGARFWLPCFDHPYDKATVDLTARVPSTVKLGSNGRLQDSTLVGNSIYYHWVSDEPVATYLMVITSKDNYQLDIVNWYNPNNPTVATPIRFYYNEGEDPSFIESIIGEMTTLYSSLFCDHPFQKNGFATLNEQFSWGGMENQTLTSICPGCWDEYLVAHEFAHQWFGDMITCGTWADLWLNEGFATYVETLWSEYKYGYEQYKLDIIDNADTYFEDNPGWAISNPDWANNTPVQGVLFNYAITYAKGACVLHMLRYTLGDEMFFDFLKAYASDIENFKYGNAVTSDFITKLNEVTGDDYSWFINEWIYLANHPQYYNQYSFVNENNGNWKVYFLTQQLQTNGFFQMPIELKIYFNDFSDTIVKAMNTENAQMLTFTFDKQPYLVEFDPNNNIVLKEDTLFVSTHELSDIFTSFTCFPNPANNVVNVRFSTETKKNLKIDCYDHLGKLCYTSGYFKSENNLVEKQVFTGNLADGIYFIKVSSDENYACQKIIISK